MQSSLPLNKGPAPVTDASKVSSERVQAILERSVSALFYMGLGFERWCHKRDTYDAAKIFVSECMPHASEFTLNTFSRSYLTEKGVGGRKAAAERGRH